MSEQEELEQLRAQRAATAEILRIIAASPADTQPVFDAIVKSGLRFFPGGTVTLRLIRGDQFETAATTSEHGSFVVPLADGKSASSRSVLRRESVQIADLEDPPDWVGETLKAQAARHGWRALLVAPLLGEKDAIGVIAVTRSTPGAFSQREVTLLESYADQAVIAIEKVRLFNETKEALEQQTATAEILRVISGSPTDLQPVFDAIARSAAHVCSAEHAVIRLVEGAKQRPVAEYGSLRGLPAVPIVRTSVAGRAIIDARTVHVHDIAAARAEFPDALSVHAGFRTLLATPLLRDGVAIGTIGIRRLEPRPFTDSQIRLLETFAAQAVIAIENVRLFKETKEALERQRAAAEMLKIRTDQLDEANRAKSRFLAAASHDLRQPVHALGLFVAQLQGARDPAIRERIIGKVEASTAAVSQLVEALLDISRLDQGTIEPQIVEFALQPLLDRLEQAFSVAAQQKDLRFRLRRSPLWVRSDPVLLERIVLNLVANAVRYTKQGGVVIAVRRRAALARIEVWDTGIGISAEEQRHIFEEFYQAAGVPDGAAKGLGLGLAIVDRLARLLGLTVWLRSVPGAGSVFAIEVPSAAGPAVRERPASPPPATTEIAGLRVLVIDDDDAAREAAEGLLTQWGCEVVCAASGMDAQQQLEMGAAPSVIISDYRLGPHERGTDVVKAIRKRLGRQVPAMIVSADSSATSLEMIAAEHLHLLRKPLKAAQLRVLLHHVIAAGNADENAVVR